MDVNCWAPVNRRSQERGVVMDVELCVGLEDMITGKLKADGKVINALSFTQQTTFP